MADELLPPIVGSVNPTLDALATPSFGPPVPVAPRGPQPPPQAPSFGRSMLPIVASLIASRGNPAAMGVGMAAFTRGQRLKRAQQEDDWTRQQRERMEAAQFYGRAIEQAQQFDDPIAFEEWRRAVAPMAQVYGVDVQTLPFNATRASQKQARDIIDNLRKSHGEVVDDPAWRDQKTAQFQGRQAAIEDIYAAAKLPVVRSGGGLVGPTPKNLIPNTSEEQFYATFAKERGKQSFADLTTTQQGEAREEWSRRGRQSDAATPGSFEDYIITYARDIAKKPLVALTAADKEDARKRFNQADDRPRITVNTGGARTDARIDRVLARFDSHPIVKEFNEVQAQEATIRGVLDRPWSGPGDMSIIFGFMKALDPNSVVRETEYANAAKSGNIFTGWAARFNGALNPNGGFLSEQVKRSFLAEIQARLGVKRKQYDNLRKQTSARIDRIRAGAPETGDEALTDYGAAIPGETQATTPAPLLVGPRGSASRSRVLPPTGDSTTAPPAPAGWKYVPKSGGGWTAVEDK